LTTQGDNNFRNQRLDYIDHYNTLGKLREHELEMIILKEMETIERKTKS